MFSARFKGENLLVVSQSYIRQKLRNWAKMTKIKVGIAFYALVPVFF